jgi:hypothetical protein
MYNNTALAEGIILNYAGSSVALVAKNNLFLSGTHAQAMEINRALCASLDLDYNRYYGGTVAPIKDVGVAYHTTIAAWRAAATQDAHSEFLASGPAAGIWIAGVRGSDGLQLPLHPDIGAVQDRDYPGRKVSVGGGDF